MQEIGATATNPQTGQKAVFTERGWQVYTRSGTNPQTGERAYLTEGGPVILPGKARQGPSARAENPNDLATNPASVESAFEPKAAPKLQGNPVSRLMGDVVDQNILPGGLGEGVIDMTAANAQAFTENPAKYAADIATNIAETPFNAMHAARMTVRGTGQAAQGYTEDAGKSFATAARSGGKAAAGAAEAMSLASPVKISGKAIPKPSRAPEIDIDALRKETAIAYREADDLGAVYDSRSLDNLLTGVQDDLIAEGIDKDLHPNSLKAFNRLVEIDGKDLTLTELERVRRTVNKFAAKAAGNPEFKDDARIAGIISKNIDEFIDATAPVVSNGRTSDAAASAIRKARDLARRSIKLGQVDDAITRAERRAASTGSGANEQNAIRQNIRSILDSPKKSRGFTSAERQLMERVVRGTGPQNFARLIGKAAPTGVVSAGGAGYIGSTLAGPIGAALAPAVGIGARAYADKATLKSIERLRTLLAKGADTKGRRFQISKQERQELLDSLAAFTAATSGETAATREAAQLGQ